MLKLVPPRINLINFYFQTNHNAYFSQNQNKSAPIHRKNYQEKMRKISAKIV